MSERISKEATDAAARISAAMCNSPFGTYDHDAATDIIQRAIDAATKELCKGCREALVKTGTTFSNEEAVVREIVPMVLIARAEVSREYSRQLEELRDIYYRR